MKRICLFAGYNSLNCVQKYVVDYIAEISKFSDVHYLSDGQLSDCDISLLSPHCKSIQGFSHGKYDFGSYSELAKLIGWEKISEYDELLLINDSCFLLKDLTHVFEKMSNKNVDCWALLATDEYNNDHIYSLQEYLNIPNKKTPLFCLGSYFMAFRKTVTNDPDFRVFLDSVAIEKNRHDVCIKYEMGLTSFLKDKKFNIDCYVDIVYRGASIYNVPALRLLQHGFPVVKCRIFNDNPLSIKNLKQWVETIKIYTGDSKIDNYLLEYNYLEFNKKPRKLTKSNIGKVIPPLFNHGLKHFIKQFTPPFLFPYYWGVKDAIRNKRLSKYIKSNLLRLFKRRNNEYADDIAGFSEQKNLMVYFNVARDTIGGGMLSINRFVYFSTLLQEHFNFKVLMSGLPLENTPVKYSLFEQAAPMISFSDIVNNCTPLKLTLNIPEYYLPQFLYKMNESQLNWLKTIPYLHINILDQNHDYFPSAYDIEVCREITDNITITTAHTRYTTEKVANQFNCPIKLLTPFLPTFYKLDFDSKDKIIALSADIGCEEEGLTRSEIIDNLMENLPDYQFVTIENMSLEEYKQLISKAKYTITFGEGYDGYFLEPFLSNSIAFAVYNETFFPKEFNNAPTVYPSWKDLLSNITNDIRAYDVNQLKYNQSIKDTLPLIKKYTNEEKSLTDLIDYYSGNYDLYPDAYFSNLEKTIINEAVASVDFNKVNVP